MVLQLEYRNLYTQRHGLGFFFFLGAQRKYILKKFSVWDKLLVKNRWAHSDAIFELHLMVCLLFRPEANCTDLVLFMMYGPLSSPACWKQKFLRSLSAQTRVIFWKWWKAPLWAQAGRGNLWIDILLEYQRGHGHFCVHGSHFLAVRNMEVVVDSLQVHCGSCNPPPRICKLKSMTPHAWNPSLLSHLFI